METSTGLSPDWIRRCSRTPQPHPSAPCSEPPTPPPSWRSASGIGAGGRTGLTSVVVAICFALSAFLATFVSAVPYAATAPALVAVGIMMVSSFRDIEWNKLDEAIPAFFAGIFMALCYSISYGIAAGFIFYCIVKVCKGKAKKCIPFCGCVQVCLF